MKKPGSAPAKRMIGGKSMGKRQVSHTGHHTSSQAPKLHDFSETQTHLDLISLLQNPKTLLTSTSGSRSSKKQSAKTVEKTGMINLDSS